MISLFPSCLINKCLAFLQQNFPKHLKTLIRNSHFQLFRQEMRVAPVGLPHAHDVMTQLHKKVRLSHLLWQCVTYTLLEKEALGLFSRST